MYCYGKDSYSNDYSNDILRYFLLIERSTPERRYLYLGYKMLGCRCSSVLHSCVIVLHICVIGVIVLHSFDFWTGVFLFFFFFSPIRFTSLILVQVQYKYIRFC